MIPSSSNVLSSSVSVDFDLSAAFNFRFLAAFRLRTMVVSELFHGQYQFYFVFMVNFKYFLMKNQFQSMSIQLPVKIWCFSSSVVRSSANITSSVSHIEIKHFSNEFYKFI